MDKRLGGTIILAGALIFIPFCNKTSPDKKESKLEKNIEKTTLLNTITNLPGKYSFSNYNENIKIPSEIKIPQEYNNINFPKIPYEIKIRRKN